MSHTFDGAARMPTAVRPLLLALARLHIKPQDLMRWYSSVYDECQCLQTTKSPRDVNPLTLATAIPAGALQSSQHPETSYESSRQPANHAHSQSGNGTGSAWAASNEGIPGEATPVEGVPAFFCPWPGCRRFKTYVRSKDCKRHAESHWMEYLCQVPDCRKACSRLDHLRKHESNDHAHEDGDLVHAAPDEAAKIINPWLALGCGFCWRVFSVDRQSQLGSYPSMHTTFGEFTHHVFEHVTDVEQQTTRAEWKLSCVIWSLLHGANVRGAWESLYSGRFPDLWNRFGPLLEWDDHAALGFIRRLQAGEQDASLLLELLDAGRAPLNPNVGNPPNTSLNAPPFAVTVTTAQAYQPATYQEATAVSAFSSAGVDASAYPDLSSSWRSDAVDYTVSSPYPQAMSPSGRLSGVSVRDEYRDSNDTAATHTWLPAGLYEEPTAQAGALFSNDSRTGMGRTGVRWGESATTHSPLASVEDRNEVQPEANVPTRGHRSAIAARLTRIIEWPARKASSSPSSNASEVSLTRNRHSREMSWSEHFKRLSRSSTGWSGLRREAQPSP